MWTFGGGEKDVIVESRNRPPHQSTLIDEHRLGESVTAGKTVNTSACLCPPSLLTDLLASTIRQECLALATDLCMYV